MKMSALTKGAAASLLAVGLLAAAPAFAQKMKFSAMLDGAQQNPPVTTSGKGTATATYDSDTKMLTYDVEYSGLSGPATAAHIHGPAAKGANAGVALPFADPKSPIKGEAKLTDAQAKELMDGMMYVNVHTAAHKDGEIRGQLEKSAM